MPNSDPEKRKAYARAWYEANREKIREQQRARREANKEKIRERDRAYREANADKMRVYRKAKCAEERAVIRAAKGDTCSDCGGTFPPRKLHFHHRDPASKLFNVGTVKRRSHEVVRAEIAKCDVLCKPCHEARHRALQRRVSV